MLRALAVALLAGIAFAQDAKQPRLPQVLLFGDISLNNHYQNTQKALKGKAVVVRSPLGHLGTGAALTRIDEVLQQQQWDVICINFGINDLMHRDPNSKRVRAMSPKAGGVPVTSLDDYDSNLMKLIPKLREASSRILWLTTMPLNPRQNSGAINAEDIGRYNVAAGRCMKALVVEVVDLHMQIEDRLATAKNPRARNRKHNDVFKKDLSAPLVQAILAIPPETVHDAGKQAHCARCKTLWGAKDLRACRLHRAAGVGMDPRCKHCRYHGAYKFLFASYLSDEEKKILRQGKEPATKRPDLKKRR